MSRERPILFSAPMVRAILEGRKTQTRRVVNNTRGVCAECWASSVPHNKGDGGAGVFGSEPYLRVAACEHNDRTGIRIRCPYGLPGDVLYVRETFSTSGLKKFHYTGNPSDHGGPGDPCCAYASTATYKCGKPVPVAALAAGAHKWKPSIHMPRWASRISLRIVTVRVERLQDISESDAKAEGARELPLQEGEPGAWWTMNASAGKDLQSRFPIGAFWRGWDSINAKRAPWSSNPFVWVVEFERVTGREKT